MDDAINQMQAYGLNIDPPLVFGSVQRVDMQDEKRGKKSGWYIVHEFSLSSGETIVVGRFGSWKYGDSQKIEVEGREFTAKEKAEYRKKLQEQQAAKEAERKQVAKDAAERAQRIWQSLEKYTGGKSDYLVRKKVKPFGVRFSNGSIVIPVRNIAGELVGLQFIKANGEKKFLTGIAKRGAFHLIGNINSIDATPIDSPAPSLFVEHPICIAEGYATAASIHMATGWPCLVAFDAGNLKPVAEAVRTKYSTASILICCDDDSAKQDTGRVKGEEAAKAVNGRFVLPDFSHLQSNNKTANEVTA